MAWPETVRKSDLKITWFSGSGAGGQHRNRHPNCCRMEHIPTGIRSQATEHKEREQNQRSAFRRLAQQLKPLMQPKAPKAERSDERIRTYHEPRQEVKDHRTGKKYSYQEVLNGELDEIMKDLR